jgi:hypothetical protein
MNARLQIVAIVEHPTGVGWTEEQVADDARNALADFGYFVVRVDVEPLAGTPSEDT